VAGVTTAKRAVLEVSHAGERAAREVFTQILDLRNDLARAGITLREVRGGRPGQIRIAVGPGAEWAALRVLDLLAGRREVGSGGVGIVLDLPAPGVHLDLPRQAPEARRQLLAAADGLSPAPCFPAAAVA
jgi:hypothetical protein